MERHKIVPDVIDTVPKEIIEVTYDGGLKVNLGNELTPTQVKDQPLVTWKANPNILYTLLMTDPDAPSREDPINGEVRHWLVINIPGNAVLNGQVLFEYRGSGPPKDTGLHRYVFLVFEQKRRIERSSFVSKDTREGRLKTSTRKLMEDFHLNEPVAGNFYQAQYDDYVARRNEEENKRKAES